MDQDLHVVNGLLARVRSRWRRLLVFQATFRSAIAGAGVLAVVLFLARWTTGAPTLLACLGVLALLLVAAAFAWGARPAREHPSDARVARFIEERHPSLDDRLASAVDLLASEGAATRSTLAGPMLADAGRAASAIDPVSIVTDERLRRAGIQAVAAVVLLSIVAFAGRDSARRSFDALSFVLFPSRVRLEVVPGHARIGVGTPLTIEARLVGNRAPVVAELLRADAADTTRPEAGGTGKPDRDGREWQAAEMVSDASGAFRLRLDSITSSFRYRVVAGALTSPIYDVSVLRPPRVTRIDLEYRYPAALGLAAQVEEDTGDIYAPAGTEVRIRVSTDRPLVTAQMTLGDGKTVTLGALSGLSGSFAPSTADTYALTGTLRVIEDNSYRIALADRDGLRNPGDTEYFIRTIEDRPPEVHVRKPARDRSVTSLEEIEIEAEAEDDFGIDRLELVYAVRGAAEHVLPLETLKPLTADRGVSRAATLVTGRRMLYLEDLDVEPGDFISYYVRARDRGRGKRSSEGRSDIFFLEVRPFEQEFVLARSQASGGGKSRSLDDLLASQKEVIVATWKLDRRRQAANGAKSDQDIRAVAKAESDLKKRVEETSSSFRESNLRDPRQRVPQPGRGQPQPARAGQTRPEEDAMTAAAGAMGKAVTSLNGLKTAEAIPSEMDALNHLLKAQADVKRLEVARQQAGSGGGNRSTQDVSSLFDRELQRDQQTNYETPSAAQKADATDLADSIKELARRQDELNRRQQGAERMTDDQRRRELEKLTRDQTDLRQRAEDLAKQMEQQPNGQAGPAGQAGQAGRAGQRGQAQQGGPGGQGGRSGQQMRAVSEEMRNAAGDLRRQDPRGASERGAKAVEKLQDLERQLRTGGPDERRRALGEMQLEARQIAQAERQLASGLNGARQPSQGSQGSQGSRGSRGSPGSTGAPDSDTLRRLAGEQERLADRARRVQDGLDQQAAAMAGAPATGDNKDLQRAIGGAASDLNRQRLADRMKQSAEQLRAAAGQADARGPDGPDGRRQAQELAARAAAAQEAMARDLESLADKLANAQAPRDDASRRLADQRARAQELREDINRLTSELDKLQSGPSSGRSDQKSAADAGPSGRGQAGGGGSGSDLARLQQDYTQRLQETRELLAQMRRDDPSFSQGGPGLTLEGQGMTLSAPGTEAFKQDFARWEQLRRQATQLLNQAETSLSQRLQAANARDRLAVGGGDRAPAEYQTQVDDYFKALATRKR